MRKMQEKIKKRPLASYSVIYSIVIGIIIIYTWVNSKIVIGGTDGINQHYRAMVYISNLYRQMISSAFKGDFVFPMYDFGLGMGDDILSTLNYYGLGDPFYLITIFVPQQYMPYFYTLFFYFRLYLAGVALIIFLKRVLPDKKTESYVVAAFVYCFSGFALEANCHIIFVHAMMYLPLILWAIAGCYDSKKYSKRILIISVSLLACTNIYYLYIISIIAAIYAMYMFISAKKSIISVFKIAISYAAGLSSSAVVLLPVVKAVLVSNRQEVPTAKDYIRLLYNWREYKLLFYRLFYVTDNVRGMAAIPIIGLICVLLVIVERKRKGLVLCVVVGAICYCIPIVPWLMSGMGGNVYGRWELALTLIGSACVVEAWDELIEPNMRTLTIIWIFLCVLFLVGIVDHTLFERSYRNSILGCIICNVVISFSAMLKTRAASLRKMVICGISILCAVLTWVTNVINYSVSSIKDYSDIVSKINASDDELYRIDFNRMYNFSDSIMNISMVDGFSTTTEYFSIDNPGLVNGRGKLGLGDSYLINGFDGRTALQTLASLRYIIADTSDFYIPPYGFEKVLELSDEDFVVYRNSYAMPIAYLYDKSITNDFFYSLNPIEKQVYMSKYAAYESGNTYVNDESLDYVQESGNIVGMTSEKINGDFQYSISCICGANRESYLILDDSFFRGVVDINGYTKKVWGQGVQSINLGFYNSDSIVKVVFSSNEVIENDSIKLIELDVTSLYDDMISQIQRVNDVEVGNNLIRLVTNEDSDAIMCLSIPYTTGWSSYIDGDKVNTFLTNSLFIGISVPKGFHKIEFRYATPGLKEGFIISMSTIVGLLVVFIVNRKKAYDYRITANI